MAVRQVSGVGIGGLDALEHYFHTFILFQGHRVVKHRFRLPPSRFLLPASTTLVFAVHQMDPGWCRHSQREDNPPAWLVEVSGVPVDERRVPQEVQGMADGRGRRIGCGRG